MGNSSSERASVSSKNRDNLLELEDLTALFCGPEIFLFSLMNFPFCFSPTQSFTLSWNGSQDSVVQFLYS